MSKIPKRMTPAKSSMNKHLYLSEKNVLRLSRSLGNCFRSKNLIFVKGVKEGCNKNSKGNLEEIRNNQPREGLEKRKRKPTEIKNLKTKRFLLRPIKKKITDLVWADQRMISLGIKSETDHLKLDHLRAGGNKPKKRKRVNLSTLAIFKLLEPNWTE